MTRSKLLEQVKIVGDGTTAFAKGTASTMVLVTTGSNKKVQTCDTSDGTYEDYVTGLAAGTHNIDISGARTLYVRHRRRGQQRPGQPVDL